MPGVAVRENESFENLLRRFKKQVQKSGVIRETKKRRQKEKEIPLGSQKASQEAQKNATHESKVMVSAHVIALGRVNRERSGPR